MKKLIILTVLLTATSAIAAPTSEFIINSITSHSVTKTKTVTLDFTTPVLFQTSESTCGFTVSGSSVALPLVANVPFKFQPTSSAASAVFSCTSSAGKTIYQVK